MIISSLAIVTAVSVTALMPNGSSACGTFEKFFAQHSKNSIELEKLLINLQCVAYNYYHPDKHAEPLLKVLLKAVRSKRGISTALSLFEKYECLPLMRQRPEYAELLEAFGEVRCTPEGFFSAESNQLLIVSVSKARIRYSPSMEASIIDSAPRGSIVKRLAKEGNWFRIKTRWGNVGYVHSSCLRERKTAESRGSDYQTD